MLMTLRRQSVSVALSRAFLSVLLVAHLSLASVSSFAAEVDDSTPDLKSIKSKGELRVAITHFDIPPFHMRRPDGTYSGKDIQFTRALGDALKVRIVFVDEPTTFDEVVTSVARGRADIGLSKLSQTYDRVAYVRFSEPYVTLRHAFLYNRAAISQLANGGPPEEALREFSGNIGVIGASAYVDFATADFPKARIVPFGTWDSAVEALKSHKVDLVYRDEFEVRSILIHDPSIHIEFGAAVLSDRRSFLAIAICDACVKLEEFINYFIAQHPRAYSLDELLTTSYAD
jgi:polar amino acid transport system substrate-binding protein